MGPDLVEIGFVVDTSGMEKGAKQSEEFLNKLSQGFKDGKVSVDQFSEALDKLPVTNQIEVLQKLGFTAAEAAKRVKEATDASRELSTEGSSSKSIFQSLLSALTGYGAAHKEASEEVEEHTEKVVAHGHAHHATTEAIHVFREGLYALRPAFADVGIGLQEASKFSMAARQGFIALAAAVVGTFIVEIVRTGSEIEKLHKQFGDTFGVTGPEMFEKSRQAAESLHTTVARLAPSIDTVYSALRRNQIEQQQELKKDLEKDGHLIFAPTPAGDAAAQQIASLNMGSLAGKDSKLGKELQDLTDIFKGVGQGAYEAEAKAGEFFASIPKSAEQARSAAVMATADFTKLFEVSGMGSDNAAKATQKFFEEIKKGGLTSGTFDEITKESREAARAIAEAFGFTGPEAVEKFGATLDTVGKLTFPEFITALNKSHDDIEKLVVPPSVAGSWSKFKEAFFDVFDALAEGLGGKGGKGATAFLDDLAKGLKDAEPGLVKFEQAVLSVFGKIKDGTGPLIKAMQGLKELYDWADARASQTSKPGEPSSLGGMDPNPTGIPPFDWIARFAASSAVGMGIPPVAVDNAVTGMENGPGGATNQPKFESGSASIGAVIGQLDDAMGKTEQAATGAATDTVALAGGITDVGTSSETAKGSISTFSDALKQSGEGYVLLSQGIATAVGDAESQLGSFFSWLSQKASEVANTTSGGEGGPSFDTGSEADIGSNAVGGIYTIGATGGVASGSTKASGTDTIKLTGTVSPGEVIAVIPADKANQATLNQLQSVINESPISIGGGTVSGLGAINASELVAAVAGSGGVGYPTSLSDPEIKALLAQIAALASGKGGPAAAAVTAAANRLGLQGGGGANIKEQPSKDEKHKPEEQNRERSSSGGGGAAPASRVASRSASGPSRIDVHPQKSGAEQFFGNDSFDNQLYPVGPVGGPSDMTFGAFASNSYDLPYNSDYFDPYSAYGGNDIQPITTSYDQPYDSPFYSPYSAGSGGDNFSADNAYSTSSYADMSYQPDWSNTFTDYATAADTVDIGANATGGVYTVKGSGGSEAGYSGHDDTMNLTGTVSPGELVAVIPADKASTATVSQLQNLISNSSINVGAHGGAAALSLSNDQVTALLAKIAALMAAKAGTTPTTSLSDPRGGLQGAGAGGFNTKPSKEDEKPKEDQQRQSSSGSGGGAAPAARAASRSASGPSRIDVPHGDEINAGDLHGGTGGFTDNEIGGTSAFTDYAVPFTSAYGGDGSFQPSMNSYDNAYNSEFYSPYSAGPGDFQDVGTNYANAYSNTDYGDMSYQPDWSNTFTDYTGGQVSANDYVSSGFDAGGFTDYSGGTTSSVDNSSVSANDYVSAGFDAGGFDAGSYAHGGSFTVPNAPGGGTDTVDTKLHLTGGEEVGVFPAGSSPSMSALTGSGGSTDSYYGNLALNAQSNIPADQNPSAGQPTTVNVFGAANVQEFLQSRMAIQRALRVTG